MEGSANRENPYSAPSALPLENLRDRTVLTSTLNDAMGNAQQQGAEAQKNPEKAMDKFAKALESIAKVFNDLGMALVKIFGVEAMRSFAAGLKQGDWMKVWLGGLLESAGVCGKIIITTIPK